MAVPEWARNPEVSLSGAGHPDPYSYGNIVAQQFHGRMDRELEDITTSALFPVVKVDSDQLYDWNSYARTQWRQTILARRYPFDTEQQSAYAKILGMATEEVAAGSSLPAFMGSVLLT